MAVLKPSDQHTHAPPWGTQAVSAPCDFCRFPHLPVCGHQLDRFCEQADSLSFPSRKVSDTGVCQNADACFRLAPLLAQRSLRRSRIRAGLSRLPRSAAFRLRVRARFNPNHSQHDLLCYGRTLHLPHSSRIPRRFFPSFRSRLAGSTITPRHRCPAPPPLVSDSIP